GRAAEEVALADRQYLGTAERVPVTEPPRIDERQPRGERERLTVLQVDLAELHVRHARRCVAQAYAVEHAAGRREGIVAAVVDQKRRQRRGVLNARIFVQEALRLDVEDIGVLELQLGAALQTRQEFACQTVAEGAALDAELIDGLGRALADQLRRPLPVGVEKERLAVAEDGEELRL